MFIDDRENPEKPERRSWVWKEKKTCMMFCEFYELPQAKAKDEKDRMPIWVSMR